MKHLKIITQFLLALCVVISGSVYARMYQWTESDSGTTHLSGKPPVWYRGSGDGPRVYVFDNGRLIDDTAIEVDDEVRNQLRQQAFVLVEQDREDARKKNAKALELKQKYVKETPKQSDELKTRVIEEEPLDPILDNRAEATAKQDEAEEENEDSAKTNLEDELRAMIADWEKSQTESAKKSLGEAGE